MRRTIITLGLVFVMSLVGASAYAQATGPAHEHGQHSSGPAMDMPAQHSADSGKGLSLTPEQKTKFRELQRKFIGENAQLIGALVAKRLEFRSLWTDPKSDPKAIMDKGKELTAVQAQLRDKILQAKLDARSILTAEQISHWKAGWLFGHRRMMRYGGGMPEMAGEGGMMGGHQMMSPGGMMEHRGKTGSGQGMSCCSAGPGK